MLSMPSNLMRKAFLILLFFGLVTIASARDQDACSMASLAGDWGLTVTGTVIVPTTGAAPFATVGRLTIDAAGNMSATQTNSVGGTISRQEVVKGNVVTMNSDCMGTFSVSVHDPSGNVLRTAVFDFVIDDNATEIRAIAISLTRGAVSVAPILTFNARKMFPEKGNKQ